MSIDQWGLCTILSASSTPVMTIHRSQVCVVAMLGTIVELSTDRGGFTKAKDSPNVEDGIK